ncbi:glycosyltransferase [bacterium]|nr:glycosyltransferase [bacterium]
MGFPAIPYILTGLLFLGWIHRCIKITAISGKKYILSPDKSGVIGTEPLVSVLIPALNEENNIEKCVTSLINQEYKNLEIIVVNDRSTDNTEEIVKKLCRQDKRIHLISMDHCPDGWSGKNHALTHAVKQARGKYFVFTDADTYHYPACIKTAVNYTEKHQVDLLSINPHLVAKSFWENVIMPIAGGVLMLWYPVEEINDRSSNRSFANGQFMIFNTESYRKIGGHAAVKQELLEDLAFGRLIKQYGLHLKVLWGPDLYQTHMYSSLQDIWRGWIRIFTQGFQQKLYKVIISLGLVLFFAVMPYFMVIYLLFVSYNPLLCIFNISLLCFMLANILSAYKLCKANRLYVLTHLLGCLMVCAILVHGAITIIFKRNISWRGISYNSN